LTTARHHHPTADELAAALVHHRLQTFDDITVRYDHRLLAPYGVDPDTRRIVLPEGLTWRQAHSRINRCWLYLTGGANLAPEFDPTHHHPSRPHIDDGTVIPLVRRPW
jgi:hypothetical protein